jgi:hypothetical protein
MSPASADYLGTLIITMDIGKKLVWAEFKGG